MPISDFEYGLWYMRGVEDYFKGYPRLFRKNSNTYSKAYKLVGCPNWTADEENQVGQAYIQGYNSEVMNKKEGLG